MKNELYEKLESIFKEYTIDAKFKEAGEDKGAKDTFHIFIGLDSEGRDSFIQLVPSEYSAPRELIPDAPMRVSLEFNLEFPVRFSAYTLYDIARLVSFLNASVDLPGFYISEMDDSVGYRYVWVGDGKGIDHQLILGLMGSITILRDLYISVIEDVSVGKKTLDQVFEQIVQATEEIFRG